MRIFFFLQRGSFVSNGERYFVEPAKEGKTKENAHFRKFHIVFRHSAIQDDVSNATSTCGLVGKFHLHNTMTRPRARVCQKRVQSTHNFPCFPQLKKFIFLVMPLFLIYINNSCDSGVFHVVSYRAPDQIGLLDLS